MILETVTDRKAEYRQVFDLFYENGAVVEIRAFTPGRRDPSVGYFNDRDAFVKAAENLERAGRQVYVTMNPVKPDYLARSSNKMKDRSSATLDKGILRRRWLLIDADPEREPSDISATDEEKARAREKLQEITELFAGLGADTHVYADSGNGYHALYPVDLPTDDGGLLKRVLEGLQAAFGDDRVKIDTSVFNPSRITKLYGTTARKGEDTEERPWRSSHVVSITNPGQITPVEVLEEVAKLAPEPEPLDALRIERNGRGRLDVGQWTEVHNVPVIAGPKPWTGAPRGWEGSTLWIVECFNGHTDRSAHIIQTPDGKISARCKHDSCDWRWQDFRLQYEPGAYDRGEEQNVDNADNVDILLDVPSFPVEVLPDQIRPYVTEAAQSIGCPADFIALPVLATCAAAIGNARVLRIKRKWKEPPVFWLLMVGNTSTKKSPALTEATSPLQDKEQELREDYEEKAKKYEAEMREHKLKCKEARDAGEVEPPPPPKPTPKRLVLHDTTTEALVKILSENWRGVLLSRDELAGWVRGMDQYKQGGRGSDRQFWLSTWSRSPSSVDRKGGEGTLYIQQPSVSIIGGIQPDILGEVGSERNDGLFDRILPAYPDTELRLWSDDDVSDEADEAYSTLVHRLRINLMSRTDDKDREQSREVVLSDEARRKFITVVDNLARETVAPGFPVRLQGAWKKLEAYLARFALLFAMIRVADSRGNGGDPHSFLEDDDSPFTIPPKELVKPEDLERAVKLLEYFKAHIKRVYGQLYGSNRDDAIARNLFDHVRNAGGSWEGLVSELFKELPGPNGLTN